MALKVLNIPTLLIPVCTGNKDTIREIIINPNSGAEPSPSKYCPTGSPDPHLKKIIDPSPRPLTFEL